MTINYVTYSYSQGRVVATSSRSNVSHEIRITDDNQKVGKIMHAYHKFFIIIYIILLCMTYNKIIINFDANSYT